MILQTTDHRPQTIDKKPLILYFCTSIFSLWSLVCSLFLIGCQDQRLYKDTRLMMGTYLEVISPEALASDIVFAEINRIENLLSKYKPTSEVSRLNQSGKLKVSPETFYIIAKAKEFSQKSHGAFDITVAPLLDLWGFTDKKFVRPQEEEIKKILSLVGSDKIILQEKDNVVKFSVSKMKIDLGGIAKGYALDCAAKKLKEAGVTSCLINLGGQIYCLGDKFGQPWKVAIQHPRQKDYTRILELKNRSAATSGDYQQYFFQGQTRFAHIFNPQTGYPAYAGIISVTVVAPDGLTADALSTAIFVLGKDKGETLAKTFPGVTLQIIEDKNVQNN